MLAYISINSSTHRLLYIRIYEATKWVDKGQTRDKYSNTKVFCFFLFLSTDCQCMQL